MHAYIQLKKLMECKNNFDSNIQIGIKVIFVMRAVRYIL